MHPLPGLASVRVIQSHIKALTLVVREAGPEGHTILPSWDIQLIFFENFTHDGQTSIPTMYQGRRRPVLSRCW